MRTLLPDTTVWLPTAVVVCSFAFEAITVLLLVDLASGLFHWLEDTFWTEKTPIVGRWVVTPNILHHRAPGAFVDKSWLESSWDLVAFGGVWRGLERLVVRRGAAPRRADLAGALLLAMLVLGLGSGCASPATGDPGPGILRAVSGTDAAEWYVRSVAAALPVTRGVPCSTWNLDSAAGEDAPRRAHAMDDSNERTMAVRSTFEERR